jgi:hypothetical protein
MECNDVGVGPSTANGGEGIRCLKTKARRDRGTEQTGVVHAFMSGQCKSK